MKSAYVSYVKNFNDFKVTLSPSLNGKHFYMTIETVSKPYFFESVSKPYFFESDFIYYPNFIERWLLRITPEEKLARSEKKIFRALLRKMNTPDPRVTQAISNFLETK